MIRSHLDVSITHAAGLLLASAILVAGIVGSTPSAIEYRLQLLFAVFLSTVVLWITKPLPYTVSSVLSVVLLFGLGVAETFQEAVIGFASTVVFFLILLLLLGTSIAKVDLDNWIARRLVSSQSTPRRSMRRLALAFILLVLLIPSATARTVTFMPIVDRINNLYGLDSGSSFRRTAYYMLGHANPIASGALMTGGGLSIVTAELINSLVTPITWLEWAIYMAPTAVVLFLSGVFVTSYFYQISDSTVIDDAESGTETASDREELEPLSRDQKLVLVTLLLAIAFWVVGSFLAIPAIIPAMFAVVVLALPGVRIVTAEEFKSISWGIIFLIGAMLSIIDVMEKLDGFDLIVSTLFAVIPVETLGLLVVGVLLVFVLLVRSTFSTTTAAMLILLPVLLEFATIIGLNQLYLAFGLLFVLLAGTFFPFNISTALLAYEQGPLTIKEVFLLGVMTVGIACLIVALSWLVYWPFVDATAGRFF